MALLGNCIDCKNRACLKGGDFPDGCPSTSVKSTVEEGIRATASDAFARDVMVSASAIQRNADGSVRNRMEETVAFCKEMGLTKVGLAFCVSFSKEARIVGKALTDAGLDVVPVCCKVGRMGLSDLGIETACTVKGGSCNPVTQASIMNEQKTDLNIVLGLCVGHDILFAKYSKSPITTLAVKDRASHHNPVAAIREAGELVSV